MLCELKDKRIKIKSSDCFRHAEISFFDDCLDVKNSMITTNREVQSIEFLLFQKLTFDEQTLFEEVVKMKYFITILYNTSEKLI